MNIKELKQQFDIKESIEKIAEDINELTGKDIDFRFSDKLNVDAISKYARKHMDKHIIYIKNKNVKTINHIIAHEFGHIIRIANADEKDRKGLSINNLKRIDAFNKFSRESKLPKEELFQFTNVFMTSVVLICYNIPPDIYIEKWIYDNFEDLRDEQNIYIMNQLKALEQTLSKKLKDIMPKMTRNANGAGQYAYFKKLSSIIGTTWEKYFVYEKEICVLGERLLDVLPELDCGYKQDIDILKKWSDILEISDWYNFSDFENVPDNYENDLL